MEQKYKQLSLIGKVWTLAELYNAGVRDNKNSYINAAIRKLEMLEGDETVSNSFAIKENSISNILRHITKETPEFTNDGRVVSNIWYNRAWFDDIKSKLNENRLPECDLPILEDIYREIKRIWVRDLKEKNLSSTERKDLFNIKEEIKNVILKLNNLIKHSQIDFI